MCVMPDCTGIRNMLARQHERCASPFSGRMSRNVKLARYSFDGVSSLHAQGLSSVSHEKGTITIVSDCLGIRS